MRSGLLSLRPLHITDPLLVKQIPIHKMTTRRLSVLDWFIIKVIGPMTNDQ